MVTPIIRISRITGIVLLVASALIAVLPLQAAGHPQTVVASATPTLAATALGPGSVESTPAPTVSTQSTVLPVVPENVVPFQILNYTETTLYGPYDSTAIFFSLPADWQLTGTGEVHLNMRVFFGGVDNRAALPVDQDLAGALEVSMNGVVVDTIRLNELGEQQATITLTAEALRPFRTGRYELKLFLDSGFSCLLQHQTSVVIRADSFLNLPHEFVEPSTNLSLLPRPIVQNSFVPDTAVVVIPDQPTVSEQEALLNVAAGLGQMSRGNLALTYVAASELTEPLMNSKHLIFVGKPANLPTLATLTLPAPVEAGLFKNPDLGTDDGLLQLIVSPWNKAKVALVVSGNSDAAVLKASKAFSSGLVRTGDQTNLAIVADVRPTVPATTLSTDRTFKELGYPLETATEFGQTSFEYIFYLPPGQVATDESYVQILFRHAAELNFELSGMAVTLNGTPIGSARLSEETAKNGDLQVKISPSQLQPGVNRLNVNINLTPDVICFDPRASQLWFSVLPESKLHMPLQLAPNTATTIPDLTQFLKRYAASPSLDNVAFVLADNDHASALIAARFAFMLGQRASLTISELVAVRADAVPDTIRQTRDLIVVGLPSAQPILGDLVEVLPAPFPPNANVPTEDSVAVIYRIPEGTSLGYLEFVTAPWRKDRTVLVIGGSTPQGLEWAATALLDNRLRGRLEGQYAVIQDQQVIIDKFKLGLDVPDLVSTALPDTTALPPELSGPAPSSERPAWILQGILAVTGLMILVILIVGVSAWRNRANRS